MLKLKIHFNAPLKTSVFRSAISFMFASLKSSKSGEKFGKKTFFSARGQSSHNSCFDENFDNFHFVDFDVEFYDKFDFDTIKSAAHF